MAAGLVFGAVCAVLAREALAPLLATLIFEALPAAATVLGVALFGGAIVRRLDPDAPRSLVLATGGAVGFGTVATLALLLGLAGWLNFATTVALLAVPAVVGVIDVAMAKTWWARPIGDGKVWLADWLWVLPAAALAIACVAAALPAGVAWGNEPNAYDVLSYHLQLPREWFEAGRIAPVEHNVFGRFPLATEMGFLIAMHVKGDPWAAQFWAQYLNVSFGGLFVLAVFGGVRGIGGTRATATVAATLAATVPWTIMLASLAYNDIALMLGGAVAAGWVLRTAATGRWQAAAVAGLAAGFAMSVKYTGVPMVGVLGGVALVVGLLVNRQTVVVPTLAYAGAAVVLPLAWWVRNSVWYGNPVSPLLTGVFGRGDWSPEQVERWRAAHGESPEGPVGQVVNELLATSSFGWWVWPLVLLGLAGLFAVKSEQIPKLSLRRVGVVLGVWVLGMLAIWLVATHQIGRFLVVAIGPACVVTGVALMRWRSVGVGFAAVAGVVGVTASLVTAGGRGGVLGLLELSRPSVGVPAALPPMPFLSAEERQAMQMAGLPAQFQLETAQAVPVYLVGDAAAWGYSLPDLHYRGVFDVPFADGAFEAWLGEALETAPDEALVVVSDSEIERLHRTYGTPLLEVELPEGSRSPVPGKRVLRMGEVRGLLGR